ncbi:MAG: 3-phosphoshikimate 1-carboxyvinyltransferase [Desulfobacteraceae bacterium]|jgi:3-phosphoshikimate 1-carboxyvinyltransferase
MIKIETKPVRTDVTVRVPGSKSYTHRTLIAAALSDGGCRIQRPLRSQDTLLTLSALKQMGIHVDDHKDDITVHGGNGRFHSVAQPIDFQNSGTSMRLFGALVVLGQGPYTLTGTRRMCERPMQALLDSLTRLGVHARSRSNNGCPPVIIEGGQCKGGKTTIDCGISSQYLSALLLIAPCLERGLTIDVTNGPVSKPYIDMTLDIMNAFGIEFKRDGHTHFEVPGAQTYQAGDYTVEPDGSNAGYFWAAAAITGSRVKVQDITAASRQGDVGLADILGQMGCRVDRDPDGIAVTGGRLKAVNVDMGHMPDVVPTLAVVASFADGTTKIRNVAHLRAKECDRLAAVSQELAKMGIETRVAENELEIVGGAPCGAEIQTYDDHRIAMSFAVAGLKVPEVKIIDPGCVAKSFPNYWEVFDRLYV